MQRSTLIWAALAAVGVGAAAVSFAGAPEGYEPAIIAEGENRTITSSSGDRLILSAAQSAETRNVELWPQQVYSLLHPGRAMRHGEWIWNDAGVPAGRLAVRVDLSRQMISVTRAGHEIGTAVVLYGANSHGTPTGRFPILSKIADHRSATYGAPMPYTMRLTNDGVALHGSDVRAGSATHGCIGLPIEFARKLFADARRGDTVLIVNPGSARLG